MKTIKYAIDRNSQSIISRVGSEIAWPHFVHIDKVGFFCKPLTMTLLKQDVLSIGREWDDLVWTRFIPTEIKNFHRQYWGMKPLPTEALPQTIKELCQFHKVSFYYQHDSERIGIYHSTFGNQPGLFHWFIKIKNGYEFCGTSSDRNGAAKISSEYKNKYK